MKLKPYLKTASEKEIIVVVGNELDDLNGYEIEAYPFWCILGTDAWFEKEKVKGKDYLVAKNSKRKYFEIEIDKKVLELLKIDRGILVLRTNFELKPEQIKKTDDLEELKKWIDEKYSKEMLGLIFAYYKKTVANKV